MSAEFMARASIFLMLLALLLAWLDGMLLPKQMENERGIKIGFPAVANGAVWANMAFISAALYFIGAYRAQWSAQEIGTALGFGIAISYALFEFVYLKGKFPDAFAGGGRGISPAGWVMMAYAALVIAAIGLFYFRTNASPMDITVVGVLLALYIPVANHAVLGWLNGMYSWPWCPRIFAEETSPLYFILGGEIAVVAATVLKLKSASTYLF